MKDRRPIRSALWVRGDGPDDLDRAANSQADALYIDLESSVGKAELPQARSIVHNFIEQGPRQDYQLYSCRVNGVETEYFFDDLEAVVQENLACVILPKIVHPEEVAICDSAIGHLERKEGLEPGSILIHPIIESASAVRLAYEIGCASPRCEYMGGVSAPGGDINQALGFEWTPGGDETLFLRSKVLVDALAAGMRYPLSGMSIDADDDAQLIDVGEQARRLGYKGMQLAYLQHVPLANRIFTPSEEQVSYWREMLAALEEQENSGSAMTTFRGRLIETGMAAWAQSGLEFAEQMRLKDSYQGGEQ
jgi:citrate lyase subunit beta/citryl-CoA lyase